MSDQKDLHELIPDHVAGRLDAETKRQVDDYLSRHPESRALASRWTAIARGMREGGELLLTPHPETDRLRSFAGCKGTEGINDEEIRREITRHVETCASCSLEVAVLRDRPAKPTRASRPARAARSAYTLVYRFASLAAAAGIVLGIGLGVLYESSGPGQPAWSGAVGLVTLDPSLRGHDTVATFELDPSQPFVPVVVAPMLPAEAAADERFGFSILDSGHLAVWSTDLTAGAIQEHLEASGVVTFLVPATELPAGRYVLKVRPLTAPDALPLLEVPFEIRRADPAGG